MAYSELDRVYIRRFIGFPAIFIQAEPRLESAITATQSTADLGTRPDSSTENAIKGLIYGTAAVTGTPITPGGTAQNVVGAQPATIGLLQLEAQLSSQWAYSFVMSADADEAVIDTFRAQVQLRQEGRRLCHSMAIMLGMKGVRRDVFTPGAPVKSADPFRYLLEDQEWRS